MLSTMLYSALMIMEIIAGSAIEKISGPQFRGSHFVLLFQIYPP